MFVSHTHSLPITTGSGQTTTHYSSSYLCISKLPDYQIWHAQISPRVTQTHITHSTRINYPGQSNTSPKLRWTGNSPIWGKITVPTGVSYTYDHPTHTQIWLRKSYEYKYSTLRTATTSVLFQRMIDRMFDHYILLWPLENSSPEYTRANTPNNTPDRTFIGVRELTQTVNVLDLNNVNNTQNSSKVSPQQNLPGTGQPSEVNDGESPERHTHVAFYFADGCHVVAVVVPVVRRRSVHLMMSRSGQPALLSPLYVVKRSSL